LVLTDDRHGPFQPKAAPLSAAALLAEKRVMNRNKDANAIAWLQAIVNRQP
jgi:hypothetical protein